MSLEVKRMKEILLKGSFHSKISEEAQSALKRSVRLRKTHKLKGIQTFSLDFSEVNKNAIQKRGNLKVYENLPKGIRVVAR